MGTRGAMKSGGAGKSGGSGRGRRAWALAGARGCRALVACALALTPACATKSEFNELAQKNAVLEKAVEQQRADAEALRGELEATRTRLENALRASADATSDVLSERTRLAALGGRMDEVTRDVEELKKEVQATRTEVDTRLDELKRAQEAQGNKPPPVAIPSDKGAHLAAIEQAHAAKDWTLTRTLGREFVNRYPADDKADDVVFLIGDADLRDGRPSSALGEFNRLLKQYPRSNVLDRTLYGMGDAYLALRDCANAKLAFQAVESRYGKQPIGQEARGKLALINRPSSGLCGP
jgi:TolA-binding protein